MWLPCGLAPKLYSQQSISYRDIEKILALGWFLERVWKAAAPSLLGRLQEVLFKAVALGVGALVLETWGSFRDTEIG